MSKGMKKLIEEKCLQSDKFVAILLPKGLLQYIAVYGCLLSGKGYIPIDINLPYDRICNILKQAKINLIITYKDYDIPIQQVVCNTNLIDSLIEDRNKSITIEPINETYIPYIIFTSGSTGEPKGVEIPEKAVVNHIFDVVNRFKLDQTTRHLATAALHFDMSVFDIFGPILHGGSVVIPEDNVGPTPELWLRLLKKYNISFWACVPALMELVCFAAENNEKIEVVESVSNVVMAGDWISLKLLPKVKTLFPNARLFSCGGPTETTNWSIIHEITKDEGKICNSVIYGAPMRNSKYHIISEKWIDRPNWVPGEMLVESNVSLANGYIGKKDLTDKQFILHPWKGCRMYRTGDLGRYLPNGEIEILGRIDNQIKINGLRIELSEIENIVENINGVEKACAVAMKDIITRTPKHIALAYISKENISTLKIKEILEEKLPRYMIPKIIKPIKKIPLSVNGKIDIKTLESFLSDEKKIM